MPDPSDKYAARLGVEEDPSDAYARATAPLGVETFTQPMMEGFKQGAKLAEVGKRVKAGELKTAAEEDRALTMRNLLKAQKIKTMGTGVAGERVEKAYAKDPARAFMLAPPGEGGVPTGPSREISAEGPRVTVGGRPTEEDPSDAYIPKFEGPTGFEDLSYEELSAKEKAVGEHLEIPWKVKPESAIAEAGALKAERERRFQAQQEREVPPVAERGLAMARQRGARIPTPAEAKEQARKTKEMSGALLEGADVVLGAPFRVVGAGVESAREHLTDQIPVLMAAIHKIAPGQAEELHRRFGGRPVTAETLRGPAGGLFAPEARPVGENIWKSLTYEDPKYLSGVFVDSLHQTLGHEPTPGQAFAAAMLGLGSELAISPWLFPSKGGLPGRVVIPKQIRRAAARTERGLKVGVEPRVVEEIMSAESHVERVQKTMQYGQQLAKDAGLSEEQVGKFLTNMRSVFGPGAERFGKAGWTIGTTKAPTLGGRQEILPSGFLFKGKKATPAEGLMGAEADAPWMLTRKEFEKEYWFHGRSPEHGGEIGPLARGMPPQEAIAGGVTKDLSEAHAFAASRMRDPMGLPVEGRVYLVKGKDIPAKKLAEVSPYGAIHGLGLESKVKGAGYSIPTGDITTGVHLFEPHKYLVERALREGRFVPKHVLKEYDMPVPGFMKFGAEPPPLVGEWAKYFAGAGPDVKNIARRSYARQQMGIEEAHRVAKKLSKLSKEPGIGGFLRRRLPGRAGKRGPLLVGRLKDIAAAETEAVARSQAIRRDIDKIADIAATGEDVEGLTRMRAELQNELKDIWTGVGKNMRANLEPYVTSAQTKLLASAGEAESQEFFRALYKDKQAILTPQQAEAMTLYRKKTDDLYDSFVEAGGNLEYRQDYFARIETAESRAKHVKVHGLPQGEGIGFAKKRIGVEGGAAAEGSHGRKFVVPVDENYAQRALRDSMLTANMQMENEMLDTVGRLLSKERGELVFNSATKEWKVSSRIEEQLAKEGLELHLARFGKHGRSSLQRAAGEGWYAVPKAAATLLNKVDDVEKMGPVLRAINSFTSAWKSYATVWRPGFVNRNIFFGNMFNLYLADVDLVRSVREAGRIQGLRYSRMSDGKWAEAMAGKWFGRKGVSGGEKLGHRTYDEVLELAEDFGVFSGDFTTAELRQMANTKVRMLNVASKDFFLARMLGRTNKVAEENARLALFMDRLRKGFTPSEAADAVARYLFNYNELTKTGIRMRRYAVPFTTWPLKNWGLQISKLLTKPGKAATYMRAREGIEDLDPATKTQLDRERLLPKSMRRGGYFRMPRMYEVFNGEMDPDATRSYLPLGNLVPLDTLNVLAVHDPELFVRNVGDMLHPLWKMAWERGGKAPSIGTFGFPGIPYSPGEYATREAAPWFSGMMQWIKEERPELHDYLERERGIEPVYGPNYQFYMKRAKASGLKGQEAKDYAERNAPRLGTRVPSWMNYLLEGLHPGINRLLGLVGRNRGYDKLSSYTFGVKPFDLTPLRAVRYHKEHQYEVEEELTDIEKAEKRKGTMPGSVKQTARGFMRLAP